MEYSVSRNLLSLMGICCSAQRLLVNGLITNDRYIGEMYPESKINHYSQPNYASIGICGNLQLHQVQMMKSSLQNRLSWTSFV